MVFLKLLSIQLSVLLNHFLDLRLLLYIFSPRVLCAIQNISEAVFLKRELYYSLGIFFPQDTDTHSTSF